MISLLFSGTTPIEGVQQCHRPDERKEQPAVPSSEAIGEHQDNHRQEKKEHPENHGQLLHSALAY
jgi:hypothetical protein